jgi:ABC-type dipeptide/oligopeptide/nickel transport system permease subunit
VLSRGIYGAPTALAVGLGAMLIAAIVGVLVGGVAGYFGGLVDEALMRSTEFLHDRASLHGHPGSRAPVRRHGRGHPA